MSLVPGLTISSGRVDVTVAANPTPSFFNQGVGFASNGALNIDSAAPTGVTYRAGIRQNAQGAFYGTTSTAGTDIFIGGLRVSAAGQLVYESAVAQNHVNGNPIRTNGALAVI
jgi:hypothetical protein